MVILRNIVALILGIVVGSAVNMGLITVGSALIAPPPGVDVTDPDSLSTSMHLFEARHFITPFVAHALGTLVGAAVACFVAVNHQRILAYAVGALFFAGGIYASTLFPAPAWFIAADLVLAYFPMAWLGITLAAKLTAERGS